MPVIGGGRRRTQLGAATRVLRDGRPSAGDRDGDSHLLALLEEPYAGMSDAEERLTDLRAAFDARDDRRAVFLSIYTRMTEAVADHVRESEFLDPGWVGEYLVAFANLYREAVYDYERGAMDSLADPWQVAFEAAEDGECLVVQDAALGVNAHINYDLAIALTRVGIDGAPETRRTDHDAVIGIIGSLVDDAQESLVARGARGLATLDASVGQLDETMTLLTIDQCRDSAWRTAVALHSRFETRRRFARWINDVTATGAAYLILSSRASDLVHGTLADLEGSSDDPQ
jgi:hypothetical protein